MMTDLPEDMPAMMCSNYGQNVGTYGACGGQGVTGAIGDAWGADVGETDIEFALRQRRPSSYYPEVFDAANVQQMLNRFAADNAAQAQQQIKSMKRIVRVYLVDPDEKVPVEKSILHKTEDMATDLTDQELYFELPIVELLKTHNAYRATVVDKPSSEKFGKEVFLEPVKIRNLKMQVVVIASF